MINILCYKCEEEKKNSSAAFIPVTQLHCHCAAILQEICHHGTIIYDVRDKHQCDYKLPNITYSSL